MTPHARRVTGSTRGLYNSIDPSILELARYPVNLYFNVSTPAQWVAEDNCLYPAGAFGHVSTYAQLLDRESNVMLRYLLQGHNRPLMFHEPNLRTYSAGKSLLGDLIDATLAKYSNLVTVPLVSPTQDVLGQKQASRMAYDAAFKSGAVTASIVPNTSVTMSAASGLAGTVTVPVTGRRGQPLASSIASTPRFVVVAGEQGPRRGRCRVHPGRVGVHAQTRLIEIDVAAAGH